MLLLLVKFRIVTIHILLKGQIFEHMYRMFDCTNPCMECIIAEKTIALVIKGERRMTSENREILLFVTVLHSC